MERERPLTALYAGVQAVLWMSICTATGFAAVYLQTLGYTNTQLGLILALGSLCSAALGLSLSAFLDAHPQWSAGRLLPRMLLLQAAALVALLFSGAKGMVTSAAYVLYVAFASVAVFLVQKLYVDLRHRRRSINFGVARGIGSLAYVLSSALLGAAAERLGIRALTGFALALCLAQFLLCRRLSRNMPRGARGETPWARSCGPTPASACSCWGLSACFTPTVP